MRQLKLGTAPFPIRPLIGPAPRFSSSLVSMTMATPFNHRFAVIFTLCDPARCQARGIMLVERAPEGQTTHKNKRANGVIRFGHHRYPLAEP
jgi:hypothetical protein